MKKLILIFTALLVLVSCTGNHTGQTQTTEQTEKKETVIDMAKFENIKLLPPDMNNKTSLMEALQNRKSDRQFSDKNITLEDLSNILWAAYGVNRTEDNKRTVPSAMAQYPVEVYVVLPNGIYHYDPVGNELHAKAQGDYRKITGGQEFVYTAPLNIIYLADFGKYEARFSNIPQDKLYNLAMSDASHSSQNVYLYCAVADMKTVIRGGGVNEQELLKVLNLNDQTHKVLLAQSVGY